MLVLTSTYPFLLLILEELNEAVWLVTFFALLSGLLIVAMYLLPVIVLRNRVRRQRENELIVIYEALTNGEPVVEFEGQLSQQLEPTSKSDLLIQQMYVESRWDWPVGMHVQRVVLFGLLPPFTWVMAAFVENVIF